MYMMKYILALFLSAVLFCSLSSCDKIAPGEVVTNWASTSYCLVLDANTKYAYFYHISSGSYEMLATSRFTLDGNSINLLPSLEYRNYNNLRTEYKDYTLGVGVFNQEKTTLALKGLRTDKYDVSVDYTLTLSKSIVGPIVSEAK